MDRLCTGEIYGYRFPVPCQTVKYLENSYGDKWMNPESKNYEYTNVLYEPEEWSDLEWFDAIHLYYSSGLRANIETYNYIVKESKLLKQPSFKDYLNYLSNKNKSELLI